MEPYPGGFLSLLHRKIPGKSCSLEHALEGF
jgi:hypothetical protein